MPAIVEDGVVADITVKGKCPIKQQKHIAHIILHRNAEEKIERHAETAERNHIRHAVHHIGLLADVVDHSYEDHDQEPDIRQK